MKQINGIVEFHGDDFQLNESNNEYSVVIDRVSPYDFQSVIMNQTAIWKLDLINDLCQDIGIETVTNSVDGLYSKANMEECWDKSARYLDEVIRISNGSSNFSTPIRDSKVTFFNGKS